MKAKLILFVILFSFYTIQLFSQNKNVTIDQRLSTGQQVGTLKKWNVNAWSDPFNPGTVFSFPINSQQVILGDQSVHSNQKYNNWNLNFSNVKNHHSFEITPQTDFLISNFFPTHTGITIKTSLEGTSATGGLIEFKDPWFIDYQDVQYANQLRNRGMNDAVPRQRTSPFYPNATTQYEYGQTYRGVFLDCEISPNNSYYKVGVPEEQSITVHGQSRKFYPYYWTGSGVNYSNENDREPGVVFTQTNSTATAVLKGQLMSNDQNGISNNSQRKIVRTDNGIYHIVYESQGGVWYTKSLTTNFNGGWAKDICLEMDAKNPAIDYLGNIYWGKNISLANLPKTSSVHT